MAVREVAYLGPVGTYSHLVAEKRYGHRCRFTPLPTVLDVCNYVANHPERHGVVPIENSSGGAIYETVDILLENRPKIHIEEELSLDVKLALLGHTGEKIRTLYSHFAPLEHCDSWLRKHLPRVQKIVVSSTAVAAWNASQNRMAAALGSRRLANLYGLTIKKFPIAADVPNLTVFIAICGGKRPLKGRNKTTLAARLPNIPGSLCTFLEAFRNENVNLSRIISRPIRGCPREYAFLVDIIGSTSLPRVMRALAVARKTCVQLRIVGSYPSRQPYKS
jgi:chorismate mutase/prephenate dehydratase